MPTRKNASTSHSTPSNGTPPGKPRAGKTATGKARAGATPPGKAHNLSASAVFNGAGHDADDADPVAASTAATSAAARRIHEGFALILEGLGELGYPTDDDNFRETGPRAAKALLEMALPVDEIERQVNDLVARSFPATYDEMVISKQNISFGLCPHHLLPVIYRISLAYIPLTKVLGISKLSRLTTLVGRRPVLQEQLTQDLAEILHSRLGSRGSAVYVEGLHLCMAARGIQAHEARVVTSAVRGVFRDQHETRAEFLKLVTQAPLNLL